MRAKARTQRQRLSDRDAKRALTLVRMATGVLLLAAWAAVAIGTRADERATLQRIETNALNLAGVVARQVAGMFRGVDLTLALAAGEIEAQPARPDTAPLSGRSDLIAEFVSDLAYVGSDGRSRPPDDAAEPAPSEPAGWREALAAHGASDAAAMIVGAPVRDLASKRWTLPFSRRVAGADGSLRGIVLAQVDPEFFGRYFRGVDVGAQGAIAIVGWDGIVRARSAAAAESLGVDFGVMPGFARLRAGGGGFLRAPSPVDGSRRALAMRPIDGTALAVMADFSEAAVLAGMIERRDFAVAGAAAFSLLCILFLVLATRAIARLAQAARVIAATSAALRAREREASAARNQLCDALGAISEGFALYDQDDRLVLVNERWREMFPLLADLAVPGTTFEALVDASFERGGYRVDGADAASWRRSRLAAHRAADPGGVLQHVADGRWIHTRERRTREGGIAAIHSDVTAFKGQEAELQRQARALEEALARESELNRQQRQFLSVASHELRTPLAVIDSTAQRLMQRFGTIEREEFAARITRIRHAVLRLTELVDGTLNLSRLEDGRIEFAPAPLDVAALVRDVCARVGEIERGHAIALDVADLPASIAADRRLLDQVLTNLLTNAAKYSPEASEIRVHGWTQNGFAVLAVTDHGVGIPADELSGLFQRFFRARTAAGIPGTGIGLHLVRQLVEMHGGKIEVTSREGEGSTFTVYLPVGGTLAEAAAA